jgi:hypothetical protein
MTAPIKAATYAKKPCEHKWVVTVDANAADILGYAGRMRIVYGSWESAAAFCNIMQGDLDYAWQEAHSA